MEIERKYKIDTLPGDCLSYPSSRIEQAYLCTDPVIRIRREDQTFYLTYKSKGLLAREEYNLPLSEQAYAHLLPKADGIVLTKVRYRIPLSEARTFVPGEETEHGETGKGDDDLTVELDIFSGAYEGLMLAEVEFPTEEMALSFVPPSWFGRDVTFSGEYQNSRLSRGEMADHA